MGRIVRRVGVIVLLAATLTAALPAFTSPAAAEGVPTRFETPPPGGVVIGLAGTSNPALLARAQLFEVESITLHENGRSLIYRPASPASATLTSGLLRPDSLVVVRRAPLAPPPPPPAPAPAPEAGTPGPAMRELAATLEALVERRNFGGAVSIAVLDLQTGERIGIGEEAFHLSGCVINLFVVMQAVLDVQEGRIPLDRVDSLIRRTTWSSNPVTARELYAVVGDGDVVAGLRRVDHLIRSDLGLARTLLNHPPGYRETGESLGRHTDNWITAGDMNRALQAIMTGELFDATHRAYLLEVLADVTAGLNHLTATAPGTVSHKNGFLISSAGWVDNDTGIVRFRRGDKTYAYAITMLFGDLPARYAHLPAAREISRLPWEHFTAAYP